MSNRTPIEALDKIKNDLSDCGFDNYDAKYKQCEDCGGRELCVWYIATQALAPQEPQQNTFTVGDIKRKKSCENCPKFSHCNNNDLYCKRLIAEIEKEYG